MKVRIAGVKKHSSVNGPGVRYTMFFQGCVHHCLGCQNPETWDPGGGTEMDTEELIEDIRRTKYLDGITFSGGDPLLQPKAMAEVARAAKEIGLDVWAYTGWTWEQLMDREAGANAVKALEEIDVLVDGPFQQDQFSEDTIWRGSSNQRLIDVQENLTQVKMTAGEE